MAFLPTIPQATDQLSVSQGDILNNFTILGAIAGNTNASSASINAASGFNWLHLPPNGAIPPAAASFPAGNVALYSAANPITSKNELYINKTNQATVTQIPSTASVLSVTSAPAVNSSGWTYLPSGILMKWGFVAAPMGAKPVTVTFPAAATIPAFTGIIQVMISPFDSTGTVFDHVLVVSALNTLNFTVNCNVALDNGIAINYLAIGY